MKSRLVVFLVGVLCQSAFCQSKENIPVPEYFGIYAVLDGKLMKLDSDQVHVNSKVTVQLGVRHAVGNIIQGQPVASLRNEDIPSFTSDFKIVVFSEPSGIQSPLAVAKALHLESLVFVRNLLVDTGWPQNLRRSGPENGWESGDAPELGGIATGDRANALEFLVKPMTGRADMVIAVLREQLKPGVYRLSAGPSDPLFRRGGFLFGVEPIQQGETIKCVDAAVTYAMNMSKSKYTPCGGGVGQPTASATPTASTTACADYNSCLKNGNDALGAARWEEAIANFKRASVFDPTKQTPLALLAMAYLSADRGGEAASVWDRILQIGQSIGLGVCRERLLQCDSGNLFLSSKGVSFRDAKNQTVFAVPPSEVPSLGARRNPRGSSPYFVLRVAGKNYNFYFFPPGFQCSTENVIVQCPDAGMRQQIAVDNYVAQTIPKLAAGAFAPPAQDSALVGAGAGATVTGNPIAPASQQLIEQIR